MTARWPTILLVAVAIVAAVAPASQARADLSSGRVVTLAASGDTCTLLGSGEPVGNAPCPGVRPGALVETEEGQCTLNFLFRDDAGRRYVGTAGHCTLSSQGERRWSMVTGPEARDGDDVPIGRFVYAIRRPPHDFALIRLYRGVESDPAMCYFGGPAGIDLTRSPDPVTLQFFGNGTVIGNLGAVNQTTLPARSAIAQDTNDPDEVVAMGLSNGGDSGAPVTNAADDRAVGVLWGAEPGGIVITRLRPAMSVAGEALGVELHLVLAN